MRGRTENGRSQEGAGRRRLDEIEWRGN